MTRTVNVVDTTKPVITLTGSSPLTVEVGSVYTDAGATALDNYDGVLTGSIVVVSTVNMAVVGSYTVTYNVVDAHGNAAVAVIRVVNVVDTTVPVITLNGANPVTVAVGSSYVEAGANALDNYDGSIAVTVGGSVNSGVVGQYIVTYDAVDAHGNAAVRVTRIVNVVDTVVPVITIWGVSPVTVEVGSSYTDDGASAWDVYDGSLTSQIVVVNPVNTAVVGSYVVTYNVNDSSGNAAVQVTRTVNVVDTTKPVITLTGSSPLTVEVGSVYTDAGATALDNYDGVLTGSIVVVSSVNMAVVGSYTVTYNVVDAHGNAAVAVIRVVNVVDTTVPVITLNGANPVTVAVGSSYVEAGANALDNYDGPIAVTVGGSVNSGVVGQYSVTYDAVDAHGNAAVRVTRIVNVVDTVVPVITIWGVSPVTVEVGSSYTDDGASAWDVYDGSLTSQIVVVNPVNTAVVGSYVVTYNVHDSSGNAAVQVTRTVNVVDTVMPVITLSGSSVR